MGINIPKDLKYREEANFENLLKKSKTILNMWSQRDLPIFGRISQSEMESLSRLIYPAYSLNVSDGIIKVINQNNFNYIWKNNLHYIRKNDMI